MDWSSKNCVTSGWLLSEKRAKNQMKREERNKKTNFSRIPITRTSY
jgi:hypothetical protein